MKCLPQYILLVFSMLVVVAAPTRTEAANPVDAKPEDQQLRTVLLSEMLDGSVAVNRRSVLQPARHPEAAPIAVWWQSGFLKIGSAWHQADTTSVDANSAELNDYRTQRSVAPRTPTGQLMLANWCRDHKLPDQERAHLSQVLALSGPEVDRSPIYSRMGYRQLGGDWVSPTELKDLQKQARRDAEHFRKWQPVIQRIARNWVGNPKQRKLAADELKGIESPAAIPALLAGSTMNEPLTLAICTQLKSIPTFEASQALAMLAVQSEWRTVRESATKNLNGRRIDDFAPILLAELRSPFASTKANSSVESPLLYFREEADRYYAVELQFVQSGSITIRYQPGNPLNRLEMESGARREIVDRARFAADVEYAIQRRVDDENDRTEEFNRRAASVLAEVSGQAPSGNPRYWWAWWHLYTGTLPAPKRCQVERKFMQTQPVINRVMMKCSCLIAGTPICTDRGFVAIEQLEAGDLVLAKDIDTGEIAYKPVLQTTVRQPVPVRKFNVNGAPIVASSGHNFWVSGSGWIKTRELLTGRPIHTATGMSRVEAIEDQADPAPVYNIVVADFHTYFIGPAMVLSHDVTPPEPTNVKVPGLDEE